MCTRHQQCWLTTRVHVGIYKPRRIWIEARYSRTSVITWSCQSHSVFEAETINALCSEPPAHQYMAAARLVEELKRHQLDDTRGLPLQPSSQHRTSQWQEQGRWPPQPMDRTPRGQVPTRQCLSLNSPQHRFVNRSKTNKMPRHKPLQCTLDFKPTPKYTRRVVIVSQHVRHPPRCLGSSAAGAMSLHVSAPGPPQSTPKVRPPRCELAGQTGDEAGSHHRRQSDGLTGDTGIACQPPPVQEQACAATVCGCKSHGSVSGPSRANGQVRVRLGFLGRGDMKIVHILSQLACHPQLPRVHMQCRRRALH